MKHQEIDIAKQWIRNEYFEKTDRDEIQALIDANNQEEIIDRFYRDLEFGTGGLRSHFGMGRNRINRYTVRRATQAMADIVTQTFPHQRCKMALSYDSRRGSKNLAMEAASVLAANGIEAHIFDRLNPVPLLSFAIRELKAQAGIMITASHNPPSYNGFKAFWEDGAQVTTPYDQKIIEQYNQLDDWGKIKYESFEAGIKSGLIRWMGVEMEDLYHRMLQSYCLSPQMCRERGSELSIVYTPIHGTGKTPCVRALKEIGLEKVTLVAEQSEPDEKFPTVTSPNPEDPEALELGVKLMRKIQADLVLGTDPDTDRVGVVCQHLNELHYLNGNQIGILMLHYTLEKLKEQKKLTDQSMVVKTIVTSEIQTELAQHYGVKIHNTLTGFKWIGRLMTDTEKKNELDFVFASEESFGYLSHPNVRDKDGVNAVALISEVALYHKTRGKNLIEALDEIYQKFSFGQEDLLTLKYEGKAGAEKISRIMEYYREHQPQEICGMAVTHVEDYRDGTITQLNNHQQKKLDLPSSNVIGFVLEGGQKVYLRPSGTEPKIKFYIMLKISNGDLETKKQQAAAKIAEIRQLIQKQVKDI